MGSLLASSGLQEFRDARLDPSWTPYVVDATKCKEEFQAISTTLTHALAQMRLSGNGDGPVSEEDSFKVYQSYFGVRYCHGDMALMYAYAALVERDMLESSACEMPADAKANSGVSPKCNEPQGVRKKGSNGISEPSTTAEGLVRLAQALENPNEGGDDADTKAEKKAKLQHAETMREGAVIELCRLKESEIERTKDCVRDIEAQGRSPPMWMIKKLEKLNSDLAAQWM